MQGDFRRSPANREFEGLSAVEPFYEAGQRTPKRISRTPGNAMTKYCSGCFDLSNVAVSEFEAGDVHRHISKDGVLRPTLVRCDCHLSLAPPLREAGDAYRNVRGSGVYSGAAVHM